MRQRWHLLVAAAPAVGGGHVARSRLVARALAGQAEVALTLVGDDGRWRQQLDDEPYRLAPEAGEAGWDGTLLDLKPLGRAAIRAARGDSRFVAAYDDELALPEDIDLFVNAALHLAGTSVGGRPALLGPAYAAVAPGFAEMRRSRPAAAARRVLIGFGLVDSANATDLVLQALAGLPALATPLEVTVLLGARAPHRASLQRRIAGLPWARLLFDPPDVPALLAESDLAIGAPGVSLAERLAAGVPTATLAQNSAQCPLLAGAAARGATLSLGLAGNTPVASLSGKLAGLLADRTARQRLAERGRRLVDGRGAARIAQALLDRAARHPAASMAAQ